MRGCTAWAALLAPTQGKKARTADRRLAPSLFLFRPGLKEEKVRPLSLLHNPLCLHETCLRPEDGGNCGRRGHARRRVDGEKRTQPHLPTLVKLEDVILDPRVEPDRTATFAIRYAPSLPILTTRPADDRDHARHHLLPPSAQRPRRPRGGTLARLPRAHVTQEGQGLFQNQETDETACRLGAPSTECNGRMERCSVVPSSGHRRCRHAHTSMWQSAASFVLDKPPPPL